jgi:hypothetical protein
LAWHPPWRRTAPVATAMQPLTRPKPAPILPAAPAAGLTGTAASATAEARVTGAGASSRNAPATRAAPTSLGKPKPVRRASASSTSASQQSTATPTVALAAQPSPSHAPEPAPAPPPATPRTPEQPNPGVVQLFATGAICYPSLDAEPPSVFMPRYEGVAPGRHKVFCTRNKGGAKELVGEIDLPAGARVQRTVTQINGKLLLARPQ